MKEEWRDIKGYEGNMTINKTYRAQLKAARRLFGWIDRHPYVTNFFIATAGVFCALYIFLNC